jgi:hypothetical protein
MLLGFLGKDRAIQTLFLLEGRCIRSDGRVVVLVPGFIEFVKMLDGISRELGAQGKLASNTHPEGFHSALMGTGEGMLRDHMLRRTSHFLCL